MEKRLVLFLVLSFALVMGQTLLVNWLWPPQRPAAQAPAAEGEALAEDAGGEKPGDELPPKIVVEVDESTADPAAEAAAGERGAEATAETDQPPPQVPAQWLALGSADPQSPYRMVVTVTNQGAAVETIELNQPRFRALEQESPGGYFGYLAATDSANPPGALVNVVAPGTPAALAGLQVGDTIQSLAGEPVGAADDLRTVLASKTKPGQSVPVEVSRGGQTLTREVALIRPPLEVVHREGSDPRSFLLTLEQLGDDLIPKDAEELAGLDLRTGNWEVAAAEHDRVEFVRRLPKHGLEVVKRYTLEPVSSAAEGKAPKTPGYDLLLDVEIRQQGETPQTVAYRLDGPTGLPVEGEWYASKISRTWGGTGIRDVAVGFTHNGRTTSSSISAIEIASGEAPPDWRDEPLKYLGVDAQYFACILLPEQENSEEVRFERMKPLRVGPVPADKARYKVVNTSCRLVSKPAKLTGPGDQLAQRFRIFAGPKQESVLGAYGLANLNYYGWFGWVSRPMLGMLHIFYRIVGNYGIAIIMLTVVVRLAMFPLSRAQLQNAQKMQELQPEIKKLTEKYKTNLEARSKAQQELFRKHGYNPFSGCLPLVIQMPIFIGLYRSLSVDVELRQAPLFWNSFPWCTNLSAPDMLFRWDSVMPGFVLGWLGPYFNVLPLVTVGLFLVQQKMLMPPPADEQARVQQQTMQIMTLVMGVLFFKVASGLCLYFIASSLWGLAEKKLLPKTIAAPSPAAAAERSVAGALAGGTNGESKPKDRARSRRGK